MVEKEAREKVLQGRYYEDEVFPSIQDCYGELDRRTQIKRALEYKSLFPRDCLQVPLINIHGPAYLRRLEFFCDSDVECASYLS